MIFMNAMIKRSKLLVLVLLLFLITGCVSNKNTVVNGDSEQSNNKNDIVSDNCSLEPLNKTELSVNGIFINMTKEELKSIAGEPNEIYIETEIGEIWEYQNTSYHFDFVSEGLYISRIYVTGFMQDTPRNIQVGDSFENVLSKFPQKTDYMQDPQALEHYFYGDDYEGTSGYVYFRDEEHIVVYLTLEDGPYMQIVFYEKQVESFMFGYPVL